MTQNAPALAHSISEALQVHTFVASCGVTTAGTPQAHREDLSVYGNMQPRKCPKVLNLWSQQQPKIDTNNRYRQNILAIEERFVTHSWPFHALTTLIGIITANAYEWYGYFINAGEFDDFLDFCKDLAYDGMNNEYDTYHSNGAAAPQTPAAGRRAPGSVSPHGESPRVRCMRHKAVPMRLIPDYQGHKQQRCSICKGEIQTTHCCLACSTSNKILALHPPSQGGKDYQCAERHAATPESDDIAWRHPRATSEKRSHKKRQRNESQ